MTIIGGLGVVGDAYFGSKTIKIGNPDATDPLNITEVRNNLLVDGSLTMLGPLYVNRIDTPSTRPFNTYESAIRTQEQST